MDHWFWRLCKRTYRVPYRYTENCDLVVPLGYALNRERKLPRAEEIVLTEAIDIAWSYDAPLAFASTSRFFRDSEVLENTLRSEFLQKKAEMYSFPLPRLIVSPKGIGNTVEEAWAIKEGLTFTPRMIVLVCDWAHGPSAQFIFSRVFPHSRIDVVSVDCEWSTENELPALQSRRAWMKACLLRHVALVVTHPFFGLEWVAKQKHKEE